MEEDKKERISNKKKMLTAIGWVVVFILLYFSYVVIDVNTDKYSSHPNNEELEKIRDGSMHSY